MSWYAASIVMFTKFKDGLQNKIPIWENIVLIHANNDDEAMRKAISKGRNSEGDYSASYTYEGRPATWIFGGVRKLLICGNTGKRPDDNDEITFSEMEVKDQVSLQKLIDGEAVVIEYTG